MSRKEGIVDLTFKSDIRDNFSFSWHRPDSWLMAEPQARWVMIVTNGFSPSVLSNPSFFIH